MNPTEFIGIIAGIATTGSFIPQAIKVYKTRKTGDLSTGMYVIFNFGLLMWIVYGFTIMSIPVILANFFTIIFALYILIMKFRHG